jgi:hypothetical protein
VAGDGEGVDQPRRTLELPASRRRIDPRQLGVGTEAAARRLACFQLDPGLGGRRDQGLGLGDADDHKSAEGPEAREYRSCAHDVAPEVTDAELELDLGRVVVEVEVDAEPDERGALEVAVLEVAVLEVAVLGVVVLEDLDLAFAAATAAVDLVSAPSVPTTAPPPSRDRPVRAAVALRARRRLGRGRRNIGLRSELGIGIPIGG